MQDTRPEDVLLMGFVERMCKNTVERVNIRLTMNLNLKQLKMDVYKYTK